MSNVLRKVFILFSTPRSFKLIDGAQEYRQILKVYISTLFWILSEKLGFSTIQHVSHVPLISNAFSYISNPGLLTPETPGIVTLKFGRINPRRPLRPYDRSSKGLITVARRPYDYGLALAQRTTIIAVRITLRNTPGITPARESAKSTEFRV